ncbi:hypothetical protein BDR04DRAFT_1103520 [Suillus decipiens]|nr:hypothetical protein BDR04DRAFT_1103520 [Suillus decipiens]
MFPGPPVDDSETKLEFDIQPSLKSPEPATPGEFTRWYNAKKQEDPGLLVPKIVSESMAHCLTRNECASFHDRGKVCVVH